MFTIGLKCKVGENKLNFIVRDPINVRDLFYTTLNVYLRIVYHKYVVL